MIELRLRDLNQLFNSMDPSPFQEKDLDHDAEEFILSWAQEFHRNDPIELRIHLEKMPHMREPQKLVEQAVHHHFDYRARLNGLEFRRLMRQGRISLVVGLSFLGLCVLSADLLGLLRSPVLDPFPTFMLQSFTIAGWVAMWRPLQIYLYEWWPLRWRGQVFAKLSQMPVQLLRGEPPAEPPAAMP